MPKSTIWEIAVMQRDVVQLDNRTEQPGATYNSDPVWSPEGSEIAVLYNCNPFSDFAYTLNAANSAEID